MIIINRRSLLSKYFYLVKFKYKTIPIGFQTYKFTQSACLRIIKRSMLQHHKRGYEKRENEKEGKGRKKKRKKKQKQKKTNQRKLKNQNKTKQNKSLIDKIYN